MRTPKLTIEYDEDDGYVKFERTMYDYTEIGASYFVDNQMDLELDYGHVLISAHVDDIHELGLSIIELTTGRNLSDRDLQGLRDELEKVCEYFTEVAERDAHGGYPEPLENEHG